MPTLIIIMLIIFVAFVSINSIIRLRRQRKNDGAAYESKMQYQSRLNTSGPKKRLDTGTEPKNFVTKHNSPVDFRETVAKKEDYEEWGE